MSEHARVVVSIAGSDSGGGAGIQADQKAIWDHGFVCATAITAVTAQNTLGVQRVDPVPLDGVRAQLDAIFDDLHVAAVKLGMLFDAQRAALAAEVLRARDPRPPVVLDPVMIATSGDRLLTEDAVAVIREQLCPLASLVTPNLPEAAVLAGVSSDASLDEVVAGLADLGAPVLVTGGDAEGDEVLDVLVIDGAVRRRWLRPRIPGGPFHGTGCTLSSAIAARLGRHEPLAEACEGGIDYVRERLSQALEVGAGARVGGPVRPAW